jgi:hypothetical protein
MRTVHLHIVEEASLQGTRLSCVPKKNAVPAGAVIATQNFFSTEDQLVGGVMRAFEAMLKAEGDLRHLLVLSAHGEPMTGTLVEVSPDVVVGLEKHGDFFKMRPAGLVVFASTCWGGYPSVLQALRTGDDTQKPFIVAPVVPIDARDANELQRRLVDAMITENLDDRLDALLERTTTTFDQERAANYAEAVFRFVRRNGEMVPEQGEAGLAAPMERQTTYFVVAVQRDPDAKGEPPGYAMVQASHNGRYWRVPVPSLSEVDDDAGVYALVGRAFTFRAKILRYAGAESFGELVDVADVKALDKPPGIMRLAPPYPHAYETTTIKPPGEARTIPESSLKKCRRCNWASLSIKSEKHGEDTRHLVQAACHRGECPEHAKWRPEG